MAGAGLPRGFRRPRGRWAGSGDGDSSRDVVLTFDDGNLSDYATRAPHSHRPWVRRHVFHHGKPRRGSRRAQRTRDQEPLRGRHGGGVSRDDPPVSHGSEQGRTRRTNAGKSKDLLTEITGSDVRFFSVPGGRYTGETIDILRAASYEGVCTSRFGYSRLDADLWALKRIPVTRSTTLGQFGGFLERSPRVVLPAYVGAASRVMTRRVLGEGLYAKLRSRMIEE